ncbi:uncharacterized protein LOC125525692 [Triticum urartu]|uniref:uncharacterized protein LOC125525692 n=1 Tax=Triticum urartu TaxID=4572 RepID=UPI0020439AD7|nr:uncharacterized protein LOC125525692 [Triticum urartu]
MLCSAERRSAASRSAVGPEQQQRRRPFSFFSEPEKDVVSIGVVDGGFMVVVKVPATSCWGSPVSSSGDNCHGDRASAGIERLHYSNILELELCHVKDKLADLNINFGGHAGDLKTTVQLTELMQ